MNSDSEMSNPYLRLPDFMYQPRSGRAAYANPNLLASALSSDRPASSSTYGVSRPR